MTDLLNLPLNRRAWLGGALAGGTLLALPGCASLPGFSFNDAVSRALMLSSERSFARLMELLVERENRIPEKHFLRFLDMVGVELFEGSPVKDRVVITVDDRPPGRHAIDQFPPVFEGQPDTLGMLDRVGG